MRRQPPQVVGARGREKKHEVEFSEVDAGGKILGDRLRKVGDVAAKVESLLGFTSEQFRQVVILPQGEFRNLLHADSSEKEKVLKQLFGTPLYERVEGILKERRSDLKHKLEELAAEQRGKLSAWLEEIEDPTVEMLEAQTKEFEERHVEVVEARDAKRDERQAADLALADGRAVDALFTQWAAAVANEATLADQRGSMEKLGKIVEAGRRAHGLVDLEDKVDERRRDLLAAQGEKARLEETVSGLLKRIKDIEPAVAVMKKKKGRIQQWTRKHAKLEERLGRVDALATHRSEANESATVAEQLKADAGEAQERLEGAAARREQFAQEVKSLMQGVASEEPRDVDAAKRGLETRLTLEKDVETLKRVAGECDELAREVRRTQDKGRVSPISNPRRCANRRRAMPRVWITRTPPSGRQSRRRCDFGSADHRRPRRCPRTVRGEDPGEEPSRWGRTGRHRNFSGRTPRVVSMNFGLRSRRSLRPSESASRELTT